ncbi:hypothetical protein G1H11_06015 [Phytoactinopolyspora alkaliphila]|uniref:Integral membrane protein n=1 Tax=Phytoactinopolyspora alkaliphila TaxID=1783498 RepID=A0A6N9YIS6_9ACTN|nr:hypothetical protein [Phytoactinopolyspora alkaliphila]NED94864.1 hypothetical protein [Phytoactinopolyspora alkaliphila]
MVDPLAYVIIAASLGYAGWGLVAVVRNQNPREWFVIGAAVIELLLLVQGVVAVVMMAVGDGPGETALFVSYLIFALLLLPMTLFWALAEKSRWGTSVLVFGTLVLAALVVRLQEIWEGVPGV